jgi:AbrB family looped-hinge helix DNA binding protein
MSTATITSKGQITIPVKIRTGLGLHAGDKINFVMDGDTVRFLPATKNITSLKGMITKPDTPVSIEDMKETIKARGGKA